MDGHLDSSYGSATTLEARREFARAGLVNSGSWMGWLRGGELFGLEWTSIRVMEPEMASAYDLPTGTGAVQWNLLPETKTNRTSVADVVMAYTSSAGLSVGKWLHRLRASMSSAKFPKTAIVGRNGTPRSRRGNGGRHAPGDRVFATRHSCHSSSSALDLENPARFGSARMGAVSAVPTRCARANNRSRGG
jgi:hypothetical protein